MNDDNNYALPFSEYINNMKTIRAKYAIAITKSQYAIMIGGITHESMVAHLINTTRPDIKTDCWGNALNPNESYENGNIIVLGYPTYMQIDLPKKELMSHEQYEKLKNILLEVKNYNDIINKKGYGKPFEVTIIDGGLINIKPSKFKHNIDELISILSKYTQDNLSTPKEVIIGEEIKKIKKVL